MRKKLKRRTQRERLGEIKVLKRDDWLRLFPRQMKEDEILARVRPKIQQEVFWQSETQNIGKLREEKVSKALKSLKKKGEIRDYRWLGKLSYYDLIEGADFIFIYIDGHYKICYFSVTGKRWIEKHQKNHPEVPVLTIGLREEEESIKEKIIALKKDNNNRSR